MTANGVPFRVGIGFDVHPFSDDPERPLVLGGVRFPGETGLVGHSDADVIAHACADAILGAVGLGDIGSIFADTDPKWANADSIVLLTQVVTMVSDAGWQVVNVDATVICDRPRLAAQREAMIDKLSAATGGAAMIKGKRTEGLEGLGGGIQCHAVALLAERELTEREVDQ